MKDYNNSNQKSYEHPQGVAVYDKEKNKWSENYTFEKYFKKPGKVLDIGCGTGRTSIELHNRGHAVEAVDYSKNMVDRAKAKFGSKIIFKVMDASSLDYKNDSFDYALFSFNGLDYVYPENKRFLVLCEILRVLKPGGFFVFSSHNSMFIPNDMYRLWVVARSSLYGKIYPYRLEFHPFGRLMTHYTSPRKQIREVNKAGFSFVELVSKYSNDPKKIRWVDPYPTYVCQKPIN